MTAKTKKTLLQLARFLGDVLGLAAYWGLGYYSRPDVGAAPLYCVSLFFLGSGLKVGASVASSALRKRVEPPKTGDPYRDATAAVYSRIATLESELAAAEKAVKEKRPFPIEHVMGGVLGALALILVIGVATSFSGAHAAPDLGQARDGGE